MLFKNNTKELEQRPQPAQEKDHHSLTSQDACPGVLVDSSADAPAANIFSEGGKDYRTMTRWDTVLVLVTNQVGLGILSLPKILQTLGLVPGIIAIIGLGLLSTYTAFELLQFYRAHPHCVNMVDMARVVGGVPFEIILGVSLLVKICMTCGSATVTIAIALNTISNHGMCTVGFAGVAAVGCWLLCLPRTFKFVSQTGIPSTISILAAVLIVIISLGVAAPKNAPPGFEKEIVIVGKPGFKEGVSACLKVCYAYAGNVGFVSYMAEMKDPSKDFVPALGILQVFSIILYLITAVTIYCLSGQYTTSPALGSAPVIPAKVAYGIVLPALFATGLVFGHTAVKYLYVVAMRAMKSTHQMTDRSVKSWTTWVLCATFFWILAFVLANAIPIFDSILSIASATFIAWFTFGISGVFWYHRNWEDKFKGRNIFLAIVNALIILQSLFMNGVGLWASIQGLVDIFDDKDNKIGGAFTCADNSIF